MGYGYTSRAGAMDIVMKALQENWRAIEFASDKVQLISYWDGLAGGGHLTGGGPCVSTTGENEQLVGLCGDVLGSV